TPGELVDAVRCLTDRSFNLETTPPMHLEGRGNIWETFWDRHFLAPDPDDDIIVSFQRRERLYYPTEARMVYGYSLQYSGRFIHDDGFYRQHIPFLYWLGTVADEGYIGCTGESNEMQRDLLYSVNRKLQIRRVPPLAD